jgi:hypothetical protein
MSGLAHDVAGASLPVAITLALLAAAARALRWAPVRQYLEPLTTWCLVAVLVHALAVGLAGEASIGTLAIPLVVALAAVLLRPAGEQKAPVAAETAPPAPAAADPTPSAPAATPATSPAPATGALWSGPDRDESVPRQGLWSR